MSALDIFPVKRRFDAGSHDDMLEYKHFVEKNTWKDVCPFVLEYPFLHIPAMIDSCIVNYAISNMMV